MAILTKDSGTLAAAQTANGDSPNSVKVDGSEVVYIEVTIAGVSTVQVNQRIPGDDVAGGFFQVQVVNATTGAGVSTMTASTLLRLIEPLGEYRTVVTGFTSGAVQVQYYKGRRT